jgi:hypothetical protein
MEEYSSLCFHKNKIRGIFYEKLIFNLFALQMSRTLFDFEYLKIMKIRRASKNQTSSMKIKIKSRRTDQIFKDF